MRVCVCAGVQGLAWVVCFWRQLVLRRLLLLAWWLVLVEINLIIPLVVFVDVLGWLRLHREQGPLYGNVHGRMIDLAFWLRPVP